MNQINFKQEALVLIGEYFGDYTKELYVEFYKDKPVETVLRSIHELLSEMLGPKKSHAVLMPLTKKYQLSPKE